jgi:hypothetical protein
MNMTPTARARRSVRRLLAAIDRALAAAKEVEAARRELTRAAEWTKLPRLSERKDHNREGHREPTIGNGS